MPEEILLVAVLVLIGFATRSLFHAVADQSLIHIERSLDGDEPELPPDDADWDWIHARLMDAYAAEREGWAGEMVRRIDARLQADVAPEERLETVVLWIPEANAFAMPGRHVYVSRRLVERLPREDALAFVIAHEMAHQRLGHCAETRGVLDRVPETMRPLALDLLRVTAARFHGVEREREADAVGFNLCLAAGYDAHACLHAFDVLEEVSLDWGDLEGVFGPDCVIEGALDDQPEWLLEMRQWMWERRRGYPSVRDRKAALLAAYESAAAVFAVPGAA